MRFPWANLLLLALLLLQLVSGFAGLLGASDRYRIFFWAHAIGAYGIVVLLSAKATIVVDAIRRRPGISAERTGALVLALFLVGVLATGFLWVTAGRRVILGYSLINVHAVLALALVALLVWHALSRRWIARVPTATDRRAFLRLTGVLALGFVLWQAERVTARLLDLPGSRRRFTGSYETASFSPGFPATSWLNDDPDPIDLSAWRLVVEGEVDRPLSLSYEELEGLPYETVVATIDCTGGWYSRQRWGGVPLARLLDLAEGVA
jgi:Oxidoreductase molybdopterin binding domain